MCDRLSELREAMGLYALGIDADAISVADATRVLEEATVIKNMATTVAALAAARVATAEMWKKSGERSAAHDLAKKTGTSVGQAASALT